MSLYTNWQSANETRVYPLRPAASRTAIGGAQLPNNVLTDACVWLPAAVTDDVYVSSVSVSPKLISLTLSAADSGRTPLATLYVPKPFVVGKNYALTPILRNVKGWFSFGAGCNTNEPGTWRFDDPAATTLVERCVHRFGVSPVTSLSKDGSDVKLEGLVKLKGTPGILRTYMDYRVIHGKSTAVAVIGMDLKDSAAQKLMEYSGPCAQQPYAGTCQKSPVSKINGLTPDENGNINLVFTDFIIGELPNGLMLDHPAKLSEVCPPKLDTFDATAGEFSSFDSESSDTGGCDTLSILDCADCQAKITPSTRIKAHFYLVDLPVTPYSICTDFMATLAWNGSAWAGDGVTLSCADGQYTLSFDIACGTVDGKAVAMTGSSVAASSSFNCSGNGAVVGTFSGVTVSITPVGMPTAHVDADICLSCAVVEV